MAGVRVGRLLISAAVAAALAGFAAAASVATTARVDVVVLGDSITAGFGLPAGDRAPARLQGRLARAGRPVTVLASGVFGDTAEDGLARVDALPPARVAVVLLGANDLLTGVPPARTEAALRGVVRRLRARGDRVVLAGGRSPFGGSAAFDAVFARVAREEGAVLAPDVLAGVGGRSGAVLADGLHPDARGADLIAARLVPAVLRALEAP